MSTAKRDHSSSDASESPATHAKVVKTSHGYDSDEVQFTVEINSQDDELEDSDVPMPPFDGFGKQRLMKQINCFANVGQNQVAECNAKLLRREHMRRDFWAEMDELCDEASSLAIELFDRYGRLNREYCEHEIRKGSGVWGEELDHDDILMIEYINIEPLWRRQKIGTKLVSAVLDKTRHESTGFFAFASQRLILDLDCNDERPNAVHEQSKNFNHLFRSLGFRRVGTSGWLAFTDNDSHPSRQLDEAHDWDVPEQPKEEPIAPVPIRTILSSLYDPSISGAECVCQMEEVFSVEENTPLWVYVNKIAGKRNADYYTPLEALQSSLELQRTKPYGGGASDRFIGFCQSDIACLAALTGTEIFDLTKLSDRDIWTVSSATDEMVSRIRAVDTIRNALRLKYGCTCGQCIGGFLSPRMRFALLCQAEIQYDTLSEFPGIDCSGQDWVELNYHVLGHLPRAVKENLVTNKSMRQGFVNMCNHIACCLRKKQLPDTETILDFYQEEVSEWPPVTSNYLERGGTVAAVAMMIFDRAIDSDEWAGDGTFMEIFADNINQLPTCRNDHEFGFVSSMCGYERTPVASYTEF
ncbi:hypothetical protein FHL15_002742 [Xylaria flabelliformis]|uniref:N-acetyltransferase domain-containing protein n=1 Tax=Xylaria flabelliformis TaxID=2512241 RepID=A0A553I8E2_9PEZI|nr:hypothetical protein FHL15_002742 [Xylaria flabelliformis]